MASRVKLGAPSVFRETVMTMLNGEPIETPNISTAPPAAPGYSSSATYNSEVSTARIVGIVSLILAFTFPVVGIVFGAIGLRIQNRLGLPGGLSMIGLILSIVFTIVSIAVIIAVVGFSVGIFTNVFEVCQELGPGIHVKDGVTYECNV
ncbi:hypothetical protein BH10ACT7_BH10ACT7_08490 [soil metagenome]